MPSLAPANTVRGSRGCTVSPKMRLSFPSPLPTRRQLSPPSGLSHAPLPTVPTQIVKLPVMAFPPKSHRSPGGGRDPLLSNSFVEPWIPAFAGNAVLEGSVRTFPAGVRDIDDDTVGAGPFLLETDMNPIAHGGVAALLCGQPLAVRALQLGAGLVEIIDLEAKMMDAAEIGAVRAHVG